MPELPLVSIITPSYNQASFLEETIQSVLSQGYPNLEYIIVDGGSKDGSVDIIKKYAAHLAWWVSERDSGQADALNKGFARATGEIIAWVNSDDYYLPGAIHAAVAELQARPEHSLVFGDVISVDVAGKPFNVMVYGDWGLDELVQFNIIGQPSVFMRRKFLEQAGYTDPYFDLMFDHQLWLRIARYGPIQYIPQRWSAARYHAAAKNWSRAPGYGQDAYRIIEWMAAQPGFADTYKRLHRQIWAGAHRINARYLLDGGFPKQALSAYLKGLWASPRVVLPELHRVAFAFASLFVNADTLRSSFLARRKQKIEAQLLQK